MDNNFINLSGGKQRALGRQDVAYRSSVRTSSENRRNISRFVQMTGPKAAPAVAYQGPISQGFQPSSKVGLSTQDSDRLIKNPLMSFKQFPSNVMKYVGKTKK
jgi:hypothetical protein